MVAKRKSSSQLVGVVRSAKRAAKDAPLEEEVDAPILEEDAQIVPVVEEEKKELSEKELTAARTKELKSMKVDQLKAVAESSGVELGKKEAMINALLKHEAKARVAMREQKAKIRSVVVQKKQELESTSIAELGKLCDSAGLKGIKGKAERVQRLLYHWQENDGVEKALAYMALEERTKELQALNASQLQKLCLKAGVDPFVTEIMVDRLSKKENEIGCYSRPSLPKAEDASTAKQGGDMVDALLANEAQRKKEKELKNKKEEQLAQKQKELKSLSTEELKKRLAKKGLEVSGKKDDLVEALFFAVVQEDAAAARQSELKAMQPQDLKVLVSRNGLEAGSKDQMVKALLAHEAKVREDMKAFEAKVSEVVEQKKTELDTKSNAALKDMCSAKGLAVGGGKDDRIERLVEEAQADGDIDKVVCMHLRNKRKQELLAMDKKDVVALCDKAGVDATLKDVMVERILAHEAEGGHAIVLPNAEPANKKARTAKK